MEGDVRSSSKEGDVRSSSKEGDVRSSWMEGDVRSSWKEGDVRSSWMEVDVRRYAVEELVEVVRGDCAEIAYLMMQRRSMRFHVEMKYATKPNVQTSTSSMKAK